MPPPTYDGNAIFGYACRVQQTPAPTAVQQAGYFGLDGTTSLHGGTRGRIFEVTGVLISSVSGLDTSDLVAQEALIDTYRDGIGRIFTDSKGAAYPFVILRLYQPVGPWGFVAGGFPAQAFKAILEGML